MTDNEQPRASAHAKDYKAILAIGVLRIVNNKSGRVVKDCFGFFKRNAVLFSCLYEPYFHPIQNAL